MNRKHVSPKSYNLPITQVNTTDDYVVVDPPPDTFRAHSISSVNLPTVSFCIPTLNNERTIGHCLQSIANQAYPSKEIVIVDGGSSDSTVEVTEKYTRKIFFDEGTVGSARQTALEHACGEVIALFDDDVVIPHSLWLSNAIQYFNYSEKVSTIWPFQVAPPFASWTTRLHTNMYRVIIQDRILKSRGLVGGGNSLLRRECIESIGGVSRSIHWGEDFDWAQKLKDKGFQVVLIKDALYHNTMRSFPELAKKQLVGFKNFTRTGFGLTGQSTHDLLYEFLVLGTKGMINGLIKDKDCSWMLYPLFVLIRAVAYATVYLDGIFKHDSQL